MTERDESFHKESAGDLESELDSLRILIKHLLAPCYPSARKENLHVGSVYLREAQRWLEKIKVKPTEEQNPEVVKRLEWAIGQYKKKCESEE